MTLIKDSLLPNRSNQYRPHITRMPVIAALIVSFLSLQLLYNFQTANEAKVLGYATNISVGDLLANSNSQRAASGLPAFALNSQLNLAAQNKANHMIANNYWAHNAPDGTTPWWFISNAGYSYSSAAENLAYGFDTSAGVINGWVGSPSHAANLFGDFDDVGFGIANGANFQGGENTVVVAMYGTPVGSPPPPPPPPPTDVCDNLSGNQSSVPSGYVQNGTSCDPIPEPDPDPPSDPQPQFDACTNLSGIQSTVPAGYAANGTTCNWIVTPDTNEPIVPVVEESEEIEEEPEDLCTNLDGSQTEIPEGYEVLDEATECTEVEDNEELEEEPAEQEELEELAETSASDKSNNVSLLSNVSNSPWPTIFALSASMVVVSSYLFRHVVYVHNIIVDGQKFIQGHPLVEMTIVYVAVAIMLSASTGNIY